MAIPNLVPNPRLNSIRSSFVISSTIGSVLATWVIKFIVRCAIHFFVFFRLIYPYLCCFSVIFLIRFFIFLFVLTSRSTTQVGQLQDSGPATSQTERYGRVCSKCHESLSRTQDLDVNNSMRSTTELRSCFFICFIAKFKKYFYFFLYLLLDQSSFDQFFHLWFFS